MRIKVVSDGTLDGTRFEDADGGRVLGCLCERFIGESELEAIRQRSDFAWIVDIEYVAGSARSPTHVDHLLRELLTTRAILRDVNMLLWTLLGYERVPKGVLDALEIHAILGGWGQPQPTLSAILPLDR